MSPLWLGAVAVGGVLALVIGVGFHLLNRRRVQAILRRELRHANTRADALTEELALVKGDLTIADQAVEDLQAQVAEALRIIADLSDARVDDAEAAQLPHATVPPQVWRALMEAREQPGRN